MSVVEITCERNFHASHVLPKHKGKCSRLHGHDWVLFVSVEGDVDPETGFVMDYGDLKKIVDEAIIDHLDHQHLGPWPLSSLEAEGEGQDVIYYVPEILGDGFYPSSENLVLRFVDILRPLLGTEIGAKYKHYLSRVSLKETCTSEARWEV